VVASRAHPARIEANGVLAISELTTAKTPGASPDSTSLRALVNAKDEKDVFFMDSTLVGIAKTAAEGKWTFCDNLVTLMHASRDSVAASAVLVFDRNTDLRSLAQAVHTLRTSRGKNMKIIIRELDASLRYQNELLLLRLGASLVIHRDVPVARLQLAIQSLAGQVFSRDVDVNFDTALASVSTSHGVGYLPPPQFVQQVGDILERSKALSVPYALIRAKPPAGQSVAQAAGRFKLTRNGDMVTATNDEILLFLSACPQASLLPTLKRVAGDSFEAEYKDVRFAVQEAAVKAELGDLLQLAKSGKAPALQLPGRDPTGTGMSTGTGTKNRTLAGTQTQG
jgi:cellulose biosynthesis protein BcsE